MIMKPEPIVAAAWSKAEGVTGVPDSDYALYLDLVYTDGTSLWGQTAPFATGTHDWQRRQVIVFPERPVRSLAVHLLLRNHGGKAWFRDPALRVMSTPQAACRFDGVPVLGAACNALAWTLGPRKNHFVVIAGWKPGEALIMDPTHGFAAVPWCRFEAAWSQMKHACLLVSN